MRQHFTILITMFALLGGCSLGPLGTGGITGDKLVDGETSAQEQARLRPIPRPDRGEEGATAPGSDTQGRAGLLGRTIGSIGDPSEPGLWAATPLVTVERAGRLELQGGKGVNVTLYPNGQPEGSGTQVSLGALQALGVSLTELPELLVFGL